MSKVILTQKQADAIEIAIREYGKDDVLNDHLSAYPDYQNWGYNLEPLNGLEPHVLARALYQPEGYEVEPELVSFDKAAKALEEGRRVYFHDGEWKTRIIYGEYLSDGELSGYTMAQLIKGRWSIGRER